ncbi:MAG: hypothetical protein ACE5KT_08105 [Methanosarcinales archaeon]
MERELDMSKYKPYKDYRGLCEFRSIKERKMSWPTMEKYVLDGKYLIRPLREDEIDEVVEIYRVGFPELYGNTFHGIALWSDTLRKLLETENGFMKGDWSVYVAEKLDEKKLVGAMLIRMDKGNMSIHWESGVIHPDYRGTKGLFRAMCIYNDELSEKSGAEYSSVLAATFHSITQIIFKELGWKIRGVFPGFLLSWNHEDKYYRRSVVIFDKFFNDGEELIPKEMDLIPEAEKIFKLSERLV